jgi:hypothetical protein
MPSGYKVKALADQEIEKRSRRTRVDDNTSHASRKHSNTSKYSYDKKKDVITKDDRMKKVPLLFYINRVLLMIVLDIKKIHLFTIIKTIMRKLVSLKTTTMPQVP